jgi:hypothetical protein
LAALVPDYARDEEFECESERQLCLSVRAATQVAFGGAAWQPPENVYAPLATQLRQRGIDAEPDATYAGASLISRGIKPAILRWDPQASEPMAHSQQEGDLLADYGDESSQQRSSA